MSCYCRVESGRAGEGFIVAEVLIDFVREKDEGVSYAEGAQGLKFLRCEDFAERIVAGHHQFVSVTAKGGTRTEC